MRGARRVTGAFGLAVLLGIAGAMGWAWLAGWRLNVVESESMSPLLHRNSLAVVVPAYGPSAGQGDIVSFRDASRGGAQVMHRITKVVEQDGNRFYETKGDANAVVDRWLVPAGNVHGRLVFQLAHVGGLIRAMAFPRGALVLVGVPLLAAVVSELRYRRRGTSEVCPTCGAAATLSPARAAAHRRVPVGWLAPTLRTEMTLQ